MITTGSEPKSPSSPWMKKRRVLNKNSFDDPKLLRTSGISIKDQTKHSETNDKARSTSDLRIANQ